MSQIIVTGLLPKSKQITGGLHSARAQIKMSDSIMQDRRECYITGATEGLNLHHIYAGSRRKASDKWGCTVYLRWDWHNGSDYGVHFNHDLDRKLKQECQEKFEQLYGHDKFMEVFGKNYLED